jgi:hypothetical protein
MKSLSNPKHERFARLLTQGLTQVEAYRKVYPEQSPTSASGNASSLANNLDVKARIAEIKEFIDSQYAMSLGEKRDTLRRMALGEIPTKVIRKANGSVDAVFDRLAAIQLDARINGEFAPEQLQVSNTPTLKLEFNMVGRNTRLSPAMEAEWRALNDEPEVKALPEPPSGQQTDYSEYNDIKIKQNKLVSLDSLKTLIDDVSEESTD